MTAPALAALCADRARSLLEAGSAVLAGGDIERGLGLVRRAIDQAGQVERVLAVPDPNQLLLTLFTLE